METVTFSDSQNTESNDLVFTEAEEKPSVISLEEYCKRNPNSVECLEYDV